MSEKTISFITLCDAFFKEKSKFLYQFFLKSHFASILFLSLLCALLFLPGIHSIPPIDRDEPRFAQASKQMIENNDYLDIRFQNEARHKKPAGLYWLHVASIKALGLEPPYPLWAFRLVSFIGALGSVLLVYWLGLSFGGRSVALPSALIFSLMILIGVEARLAKTDAMLLFTIIAAQIALARAFLMARDSECSYHFAILFWGAVAAGILIKGPVLPMIIGLTIAGCFFYERKAQWLRRLRPLSGLFFMLIVILPWFIAIGIKTEGAFFVESLGKDLFAKIGEGQESHGAPFGTYLFGFFPLTAWPLAPLVMLSVPFIWKTRHDQSTFFLLCWLSPNWLIFELTATKLPHYILPLLVPLCLFVGRSFSFAHFSSHRFLTAFLFLIPFIPLALFFVLLGLFYHFEEGRLPWLGMIFPAFAVALSVYSFRLFKKTQMKSGLMMLCLTALFLYPSVYGIFFPRLETIWISSKLAKAAHSVGCKPSYLATAGFREPSLVFLTQTDLFMTDGEGAARFMSEDGCRIAFIEHAFKEKFDVTANELQLSAQINTIIEGININSGDKLKIYVMSIQN